MNRTEYLHDDDVSDFLDWAKPLVTGEWDLPEQHQQPRTLFKAFEGYEWSFKVKYGAEPNQQAVGGKRYEDTTRVLGLLKRDLLDSKGSDEAAAFLKAATAVLAWGGVLPRNGKYLDSRGDEARSEILSDADLLDPAKADLKRLGEVIRINAGFTKIYSLLLDGFPIYDSRVACGLASLVRWFCQERSCKEVPDVLALAIPPSRARVSRDPSCLKYSFPKVGYPGTKQFAQSNVKAAWLLGDLAPHFPVPKGVDQLHALQSAFFMIGQAPLDRPCSHCPD